MSAKFVMLPSSTGEFVVEAGQVVYARPAYDGTSTICTAASVELTVTATASRVAEILGSLTLAVTTEGVTSYFNPLHLDFASDNRRFALIRTYLVASAAAAALAIFTFQSPATALKPSPYQECLTWSKGVCASAYPGDQTGYSQCVVDFHTLSCQGLEGDPGNQLPPGCSYNLGVIACQ